MNDSRRILKNTENIHGTMLFSKCRIYGQNTMLVSKFQIHAKSKSKQYYPKPVHNRLSQIFKFYNDSGNHEKQALL